MTDQFFTDDELVAYLDGESDFAPMEDIRLALRSDIALQKRLEALTLDQRQIANSFKHIKPDTQKRVMLPAAQKAPMPLNKAAAIAIISLLIGGSTGFGFSKKTIASNNWVDYVAAYQALYINATLSNVSISKEIQKTELTRAASAIGKNIDLATLTFTKEADFKRAQILGFGGKPLVQLAFLSRTGEPIALCIFRNGDDDAHVVEQRLEGMQSASWSRDGYGYVLIGGKDEQLIHQMASYFSTQEL